MSSLQKVCIALAFLCLTAHVQAQTWKRECVGRMQIQLPGDADVAGYSSARLAEEIEIRGGQQQFQFDDGQEASWSALAYTGIIYVSNLITSDEYGRLYERISERMKINRAAASAKPQVEGRRLIFEKMDLGTKTGAAWHVSEFYSTFLRLNQHVFFWDAGGEADKERRNAGVATAILNGISYRQPNEVPTGNGVCLPHAFIKDDGTPHRRIAMTFRLQKHPDVTVVLDDNKASGNADGNQKIDLSHKINDFWAQYEYTPSVRKVESAWKVAEKRALRLAGSPALESFVRIIRADRTIDFGYLAVSRGDVKSKADSPELSIFINSEAANARSRGIEPIGEREFIEIAKQIALSVRRR